MMVCVCVCVRVCVWGGGGVRAREAVESICRYVSQQIDHQSQYNFPLAILVGLGSN